MPLPDNKDYQAESDVAILLESDRIKDDASRMNRAKSHIESETKRMGEVKSKLFGGTKPKPFNGSVANSSFTRGK